MTSFHKKHWCYLKNDPTEQILVCYCVLRVTYTNLSIFNQLCKGLYGEEPNGPLNLWSSKKSRVKLRMVIKTVQSICIGL